MRKKQSEHNKKEKWWTHYKRTSATSKSDKIQWAKERGRIITISSIFSKNNHVVQTVVTGNITTFIGAENPSNICLLYLSAISDILNRDFDYRRCYLILLDNRFVYYSITNSILKKLIIGRYTRKYFKNAVFFEYIYRLLDECSVTFQYSKGAFNCAQ